MTASRWLAVLSHGSTGGQDFGYTLLGHQRKQVDRLVRRASPRIRIGELGDQTKSKRTADELFSSVFLR